MSSLVDLSNKIKLVEWYEKHGSAWVKNHASMFLPLCYMMDSYQDNKYRYYRPKKEILLQIYEELHHILMKIYMLNGIDNAAIVGLSAPQLLFPLQKYIIPNFSPIFYKLSQTGIDFLENYDNIIQTIHREYHVT